LLEPLTRRDINISNGCSYWYLVFFAVSSHLHLYIISMALVVTSWLMIWGTFYSSFYGW
jgi:hypothetical protein